jgi:DNA invertase Pin-like site-specific DNA recombinase
MELVAIREAIKLDSALGRALVSILLVFAQMEREATGERTRDAIQHISNIGYFFGKVPFGQRTVPAPDNPRYRILVPDEEEQKVLAHIKSLFDRGIKPTPVAAILNEQEIAPPQGKRNAVSVRRRTFSRERRQQPRGSRLIHSTVATQWPRLS